MRLDSEVRERGGRDPRAQSSALRSRATFPGGRSACTTRGTRAGDAVLDSTHVTIRVSAASHPTEATSSGVSESRSSRGRVHEAVGPVEDRRVLTSLAALTALAHRDVVPEALAQERHLPVQRLLNAEDVEIERADRLEDVPAPLHPLVPRVALARSRVADVEGRHPGVASGSSPRALPG